MTLFELDRDAFQPIKKLMHFGTWSFTCPVCGEVVGFYRDPKFDKVTNGLYLKYEQCKNGHAVDWSMVKEAENAEPSRSPCGKRCACEWGSLSCFYKRGYIRDTTTQKWVRDENGVCLRSATRECDWEPEEEGLE